MQDRYRGEQRQLPEMPKLKLWGLERQVRSEKVKERDRAIQTLGETKVYQEVPELMREALVPGVNFNSIMIGMKTLHEFSEQFGVGEELTEGQVKRLVEPLRDEDLITWRGDRGERKMLHWVHWQPAGVWAVDVFLGLFDPSLKSWSYERCLDHYLSWFDRVSRDLSGQDRQRVVTKLVDVLLSEPTYWYLAGKPWEEKVPGLVRRGIGVTLDNFSDEAVGLILERIGEIKAEEKKPSGFWTATALLCRTGDKRAEAFLRERLLEDIYEDRSVVIENAYGEPVVTKEDIREALTAIGAGEG